jgi:hypothetical protein
VRLYRQDPDRQWGPVLRRVAQDLQSIGQWRARRQTQPPPIERSHPE